MTPLSNVQLKKLSKSGRQNPVLRMLLAKQPGLLDQSVEELEKELEVKFDKTIRKRGLEYYYAEEDAEERARAEARLAPMGGEGGKAVRDGVMRREEDAPIEELTEEEMLSLGLELDGGEEEEDASDEPDDGTEITVEDNGVYPEDEDEEEGWREGGREGASVTAPAKGFTLRPPPSAVTAPRQQRSPQQEEEEEEEEGGRGREGRRNGERLSEREGKERRNEEQEGGEEEEEEKAVRGPSREGGDLRFRRSNLFAVDNIRTSFASLLSLGTQQRPLPTHAQLLSNVEKMGIHTPTLIQAAALPALLEGKEAILHSYTGSGKTLAYLLPLLARVDPFQSHTQLLIIAPSRELAAQITSVADELTEGTDINVAALIGGASADRQVEKLRWEKPQVLVGTPGRVAEMVLEKRKARIGRAHMLVLDEVDMLLDESYYGDIRMLVQGMGALRQAVFASATGASESVRDLASNVMEGPYETISSSSSPSSSSSAGQEEQDVGEEPSSAPLLPASIELPASLRHGILITPPQKILDNLRRFLHTDPAPELVLVFVNDALKVNRIVEALQAKGIDAAGISGDNNKQTRANTLGRLTSGKLRVCVTTEMAARGIDIPGLTHVVNLDVPSSLEQYVHRAGRAGRAGRPGIVLSFSPPSTAYVLDKWSKKLRTKLERVDIAHSRLIRYDEKDLPDAAPKLSRSAQRKLERMQGLGVKLKLPELQEEEGEEEAIEGGKEEEE